MQPIVFSDYRLLGYHLFNNPTNGNKNNYNNYCKSNDYCYICFVIIEKAMIMDLYSLTDNMILQKIGEFVRRQRLNRNTSQKDLANAAGVSISSVAALECGESVSLKTLIPLLRTLGELHMLAEFLKEPEISPIAYAMQLENKKLRKRASTIKNNNDKTESEW